MMPPDNKAEKKTSRKLFGFRSATPWKSGLALVYYVAVLVFLITALVTPPLVPADARDAALFKLSSIILFLWMASPAVFLSDTAFRRRLPLFKDRQGSKSLIGMFLVSLLFLNLFIQTERLHSVEYQKEFKAYLFMEDTQTEENKMPLPDSN